MPPPRRSPARPTKGSPARNAHPAGAAKRLSGQRRLPRQARNSAAQSEALAPVDQHVVLPDVAVAHALKAARAERAQPHADAAATAGLAVVLSGIAIDGGAAAKVAAALPKRIRRAAQPARKVLEWHAHLCGRLQEAAARAELAVAIAAHAVRPSKRKVVIRREVANSVADARVQHERVGRLPVDPHLILGQARQARQLHELGVRRHHTVEEPA
eukprot:355404-Chlamydomonas_euryale.AAC.1